MSRKAIEGRKIGLEVLKALGVPTQGVADFSIHFPVGGLVTVDAKIYVRAENAHAFVEKLKTLKVYAKEDAK